jgi:hypothetical protein
MSFYKDYNVLVRKIEQSEDKQKQAERNFQSIHYARLNGVLRRMYEEFLQREGVKISNPIL